MTTRAYFYSCPVVPRETGRKLNIFKRALQGEERLWKVWWLGGFGCTVFVWLWGTFVIHTATSSTNSGTRSAAVALHLLSVAVSAALAISEWRCAFNVQWRGWGWIARTLIVIGIPVGVALNGYFMAMLLGNVPPEYSPTAALFWKGNADAHAFVPARRAPVPVQPMPALSTVADAPGSVPDASSVAVPPPAARYLDAHWQKVLPAKTENPDRAYAVYAGRHEKAEVGLAQWSESVVAFGETMAQGLTGFRQAGAAGEGRFMGKASWGARFTGDIDGVPYSGALIAVRDIHGQLCWVFAVSAFPVDRGFEDRVWGLVKAAGHGEYPQYAPASTNSDGRALGVEKIRMSR